MFASLNGFKENNRLEAKEAAFNLPGSIWETYSAFANTDGGVILLGVREEKDGTLFVVGLSNPEKLLKQFWDAINNPSKISRNILTNQDISIEVVEEKQVVAIAVPRASADQRPVYVGSNPFEGTYRRNGEGDYHCTQDEVKAMLRDSADETSDKTIIQELKLDSLEPDTVRRYRNALQATRPGHPWVDLPDEDFLVRIGAAVVSSEDGFVHPTRAGLLMFGKSYAITQIFPRYFLDYQERFGNERWDDRFTSDMGAWSGNIYDFWREVLPRLLSGVKKPFQMVEGYRLEDNPMMKAVREALANCLVHADYRGDCACTIVRTQTELFFSNPGTMRVDIAVALSGGVSSLRNPTLMTMFNLLNIGEKAGSGFDTIKQGLQWAALPALSLKEKYRPDRVELTVPLQAPGIRTETSSHRSEAQEKSDKLSVSERAVLAAFDSELYLTRSKVEEILGMGAGVAKQVLNSLISKGFIVREGSSRATKYRRV